MRASKQSAYRYFFLSFSLSFLVLALLFFLLMNAVQPSALAPRASIDSSLATSDYFPAKEDALSVLFVGASPAGTETGTFLLARYDPARGAVPIVVFPRQTAVDNNGKTESLSDVYKYGGADYVRSVLSKTLNLPIDRYVRMDPDRFVVAANTIGTVEFELASSFQLGQSGALPITLSPGLQLLDGIATLKLITSEEYPGGELERCSTTSKLAAEVVNQRIDIVLSTMVDKVFEKLVNLLDTDISYPDYDDRKQSAAFLAQLGQKPGVAIPVSGQYSEDSELYFLSDTFLALLSQTFL